MSRKTLATFNQSTIDLSEVEALIVGHSIVTIGGAMGADRCFFELDNGMILEFWGQGHGAYEYPWIVMQLVSKMLPTPPIEAIRTTDAIMQVGERMWSGRADLKATIAGHEKTLVSFGGSGDGEEGFGYEARVLSPLEPQEETETETVKEAVDAEGFVTKPLPIKFLSVGQSEEEQYRVKATTQHTGGWIKSESMSKQEAVQLLHELKSEINMPDTRAIILGEYLIMTHNLHYLYLEKENEEEEE